MFHEEKSKRGFLSVLISRMCAESFSIPIISKISEGYDPALDSWSCPNKTSCKSASNLLIIYYITHSFRTNVRITAERSIPVFRAIPMWFLCVCMCNYFYIHVHTHTHTAHTAHTAHTYTLHTLHALRTLHTHIHTAHTARTAHTAHTYTLHTLHALRTLHTHIHTAHTARTARTHINK